ncbi:hypothetical protein [Pseudanabaena sp. 'Roaring Creek']|uniref:hypothetical protein n=1 Tax=Pseudanabaena sp. 'Roaring Creek' TaxID=1681830 RepID=UPI0006D7D791|nr:hypothetical protein [Pseudanabaena sp. 'Roaring Creek']
MSLTYLVAKAIARKDANNSHGATGSPEYKVWKGMRNRCNNPKNSNYYKYGKKGVTVDKDWDSFENFYRDMGKKPEGATLDRKDPKKGYSKENCRWAKAGDAGARGNDIYINVGGASRRLKDVAEKKGILANTLYKRIKTHGMSVKEALDK